MKTVALSEEQMRDQLRIYCRKFSNNSLAADSLSITPSRLSELLSGARSIGDDVAAQLGFQKIKQSKMVKIIFYLGDPKK